MTKLWTLAVLAVLVVDAAPARGYVEVAMTLGKVVNDSTNIVLMKVEKVDRERNLIIYRKVKDLKGVHPTDVIKHNIGKAGFHPRESQFSMEAAQPGNTAVFFHNGGASETYNGYWYQAYPGDWWAMSHGEPFLYRSYAGKVEKLAGIVEQMVAGQEVIVPCMVDGDKTALQLRTAKVQRLKASLRLQDYDQKRDFVGWGNEDFRVLLGMPAFSMYSALARTDPEPSGVAPADYDGDGKVDLIIYGAGKVVLLKNGGTSLEEATLPYSGGARAATWADWNGDKKPDLLLATPNGPVLLTNLGDGSFRDDSKVLPREAFYALTTAAWIDQDGDAKPDILLANGYLGLRLYRNTGKAPADPKAKLPDGASAFDDVSEKVGLGKSGIAVGTKGAHLAVGDVDGDGRPDLFYSAGRGILANNTPNGFVIAADAGIAFKPGKVAPTLTDFDGDGKLDVTLVDGDRIKLFKNDGKGKFADVTGLRGDLAKPVENAACLVWTDFDNRGRLDLFVGALKGPNRFFRNGGDGKFADASEEIGLNQKIFNTRAMCVLDLNGDKVNDVVFNNEGQESAVLLGDPKRPTKKVADVR